MLPMSSRTLRAFTIGLLGSALLFGQATDGNLAGTISDSSGAAIPDAAIELLNEATNIRVSANTDGLGRYRFNNVLVGMYKLTASKAGFQTASLQNVQVQLSRTSTANLALEVGAVSTTVAVTEAAALLDTTSAQVQTTYDRRQATMLPLTGISTLGVINMSLLSAGVSSGGGVGYGTGPSVGGQRPTNNNFMVDGIDNNNRSITGPIVRVSNEAVAEFSLQQNQFSAEFGHSTGGQFNTVIRSGTNQFHGTAFEYFQNRKLNAIDEQFKRIGFRDKAPRFDSNRIGGNLGGPILKDKAFFFFNYDYNPTGQASSAQGAIFVPTADGIRQLDSVAGLSKTNLDQFKKFVPAAGAPVAGRFASVRGSQIPLGVLSVAGPSFENIHSYTVSGDYNISDRDQVRVRYLHRRLDSIDTIADLPSFFTPSIERAHLASVTHFHTFAPSLTNEMRPPTLAGSRTFR